jgi:para-nitrobenzyl esterase
MFWLHGGGFAGGSGGHAAYDGTQLAAKHDVVVVTVNHRLNVFWYLYLADAGGEKYANSNNLGMQDIIAAFGGDANNVTIFGQSGGGWKVGTLLAMPTAKGLFHRAIQESGPNLRGIDRDAANKGAQTFLAELGLQADPAGVDAPQQLPMEKLLEAARGPGLPLAPVVDGRTLPAHPFDPVAPEVSAGVPLPIGTNATEMAFLPGHAARSSQRRRAA